ncbi:MAG TPA: 3-deoxy-manno-octulosonate cytidylyltransferase [Acidobacteriota bacterium]|nr:3-deoxy-manno-octulosonate cytidylyltransferase [Acidobacteriota bacterium]
MRFVGVVPARFASTRLPGKPLLQIAGKPLIQWVFESASQARCLERILVATDDERIYRTVIGFGGEAVMTRADHQSGTDRVAEVAARVDADVYINIQGDEPLIAGATIDAVCRPFLSDAELLIATAKIRLHDPEEAAKPQVVKVVADAAGNALYFSRSLIPFPRREPVVWYKHVGIYAYRRSFLLSLKNLQPSQLEAVESLEQLRFLENGYAIKVVEVTEESIGVDTPEDVERVIPLLQNRKVDSSNAEHHQPGKSLNGMED